MRARIGLGVGITLFALICLLPAPQGMDRSAQLTAATAVLMAAWWLTEAVPVAATALVPMVILPIAGVLSAAEVSAPYANKTNMLFLGGLMIATAVERWHLHRRIALHVIARFGSRPDALVLGFMTGTGLISMWISNSATTMMMLPIALAVCDHVTRDSPDVGECLAPVLLLAVAYSATIGGVATIVGTPPNAVFVGAFEQLFPDGPEIGFLQWMLVGVPLAVVLIPLAWLYLVRVASPLARMRHAADAAIGDQLAELGPMSVPEKRVLKVFTCTALLWMFRRPLDLGFVVLPGWSGLAPEPSMIGDSTVAMTMALLLFVLPAGDEDGSRLLSWKAAVKLPWGVIVLLGGGFALAEAIRASGLAAWVGGQLTWVGAASPIASILVITLTVSFMTEVTTNTAITTIMMPVLAAAAVSGGTDPLLLMLPCTLAASLCFMLPSGTAPNAIVFSGGRLTVAYMARTGLGLNLAAVCVVVVVSYVLAVQVFGISLDGAPHWAVAASASTR
jgi:sodium-dependent dicarboxylate transporter 2/3/5